MEGQQVVFKNCMVAGLMASRVPFSEFSAARDYRTFLLDETLNPSPPKELAARAMSQLCDGNGHSMDMAVCNCVTQFLDRAYGRPPEDPDRTRRLRDLACIVVEQTAVPNDVRQKRYLDWANSWY
jgi:hypothetical protein